MTDSDTLAALKKAVIDQKKAALPLEAPDPALEPAHAAVLQYDALVAQLVIGQIQGLDLPLPEGALAQAEHAAAAALKNLSTPGAQRYNSYKGRLDQLRALAEQVQRERPHG